MNAVILASCHGTGNVCRQVRMCRKIIVFDFVLELLYNCMSVIYLIYLAYESFFV